MRNRRSLVIHHHHPAPAVYRAPENTGMSGGAVLGLLFIGLLIGAGMAAAQEEERKKKGLFDFEKRF